MMPGFVDCHTHVVSYLLAGLRSKFDSIQQSGIDNGVNERRIRTMNVIANDKSAAQLFSTYVVCSSSQLYLRSFYRQELNLLAWYRTLPA